MKTLDMRRVPAPFLESIQNLGQDPVILTLGKKPIGVFLPVQDADLESVSLSFNPKFLEIIGRSKRSLYEEGGISQEELCRELELRVKSDREPSSKEARPKPKRRTS
jgi:hypothetical protein